MSEERGPNYDWKLEAEHYKEELDKYQLALQQSEDVYESLLAARDEEIKNYKSLVNQAATSVLCLETNPPEPFTYIVDDNIELKEQLGIAVEALEWIKENDRDENYTGAFSMEAEEALAKLGQGSNGKDEEIENLQGLLAETKNQFSAHREKLRTLKDALLKCEASAGYPPMRPDYEDC